MSNLDRYRTFGLREVWLEGFIHRPDIWLEENTLGPEQIKAFKRYMKDAELIDGKGNLTPLAWKMSELYVKDKDAVWQRVWLNLCLNSPLFSFYCLEVPWKSVWTKDELVSLIKERGYTERTARNAVNALVNTFENPHLRELFGRKVEKRKYLKESLSSLNPPALRYTLGKLEEEAELFESVFRMSNQDFHYNMMRTKI